ncbi:hypothetical protein ACFL6G_05775 [candidate division KSB1 bacterium]
MECKDFKNRISGIPLSGLSGPLPDDLQEHMKVCPECAEEVKQYTGLGSLLNDVTSPEQGDDFWNGYLTAVMERTVQSGKETKWTHFPVFSRKFIIPVFAVAAMMLIFIISDNMNTVEDEEIYSSTLEFILEEHDQVSSQYMFNEASVYLADEILPENLGETRSREIKN